MADVVSFVVRLINQVTGPALAAARSVSQIQTAAGSAQRALGQLGGGTWAGGVRSEAERARREVDRLNRSLSSSRQPKYGGAGDWFNLVKANTVLGAVGRIRAGLSGMVQSVRLFGRASDTETRKLAGSSFTESLGVFKQSGAELLGLAGTLGGPVIGAITAVGGALLTAAKYAGMLAAAAVGVGTVLSVAFAKAVVEMGVLKENTITTFNALTQGKGVEMFGKIREAAMQMGVPIAQASEGVRALTAAGFKGEQSLEWFKRMQDLSAIGVTGETLQRVVLAMSQIKGAGVLQGDELRQLQETGLNIEEIWNGIAKEMGVSVQQAKKLKEQGKVSADVAEKGIKAAIIAMTGAIEAGAARMKWLAETTAGAWTKLKSIATNVFLDIAEKAKPAFEKIKPVLDEISAWFKSDTASQWADRAAAYFGFIVETGKTVFGAIKAFLKGFGDNFSLTFDKLSKGKSPFEMLKDPIVLMKIEQFGRKVGDLAGWFVQVTGKVIETTIAVTALGTTIATWMSQNRTTVEAVKLSMLAIAASIGVIAASAVIAGVIIAAPFLTMAAILSVIIELLTAAIGKVSELASAAESVGPLGRAAAGFAVGGLPGAAIGAMSAAFAEGGPVAQTGPALVHAGEFVVPPGGASVGGGASVIPAGGQLRLIQGGLATMAQGNKMRGFADGGPVDSTGPALVHAGEFVVPQAGALVMRAGGGEGGGAKTFNATFNIVQAKGEDGEDLSRKVVSVLQDWWEQQAFAVGA